MVIVKPHVTSWAGDKTGTVVCGLAAEWGPWRPAITVYPKY